MKVRLWKGLIFLILWVAVLSGEAFAASFANSQFLVETDWFLEHLNDSGLRILDVRKWTDYEQGHIPGALHLDLAQLEAEVNGVKGMLVPVDKIVSILEEKGINNQTKVLIYDDTTGPAAARVFWVLDYLGHQNMALLDGGWLQWTSQKREVSRTRPGVERSKYVANPDPSKLASGEWVLQNLTNPNITLLDVRGHNEFTGEEARSARGGHIPGAIHVDWKNNLTEQGTIKPATDLRNMYYKAQIKKGKEIVVYCQTGKRAAQSYFVLRLLGYDRLTVYDGSWQEWGNDNRYPVEAGQGKVSGKSAPTC